MLQAHSQAGQRFFNSHKQDTEARHSHARYQCLAGTRRAVVRFAPAATSDCIRRRCWLLLAAAARQLHANCTPVVPPLLLPDRPSSQPHRCRRRLRAQRAVVSRWQPQQCFSGGRLQAAEQQARSTALVSASMEIGMAGVGSKHHRSELTVRLRVQGATHAVLCAATRCVGRFEESPGPPGAAAGTHTPACGTPREQRIHDTTRVLPRAPRTHNSHGTCPSDTALS
jgi:hypothetical protein